MSSVRRIGLAVVCSFVVAASERAGAQPLDGLAASVAIERTLVELIGRVEPAVVSIARIKAPIVSSRELNDAFDPFRIEQEPPGETSRPEAIEFVPNEFGAGIVIAPFPGADDRFMLTNYHVVRGGPPVGSPLKEGTDQILVRFADRRSYSARILAADPRSDLAVLTVDYGALGVKPADLKSIPLRSEGGPMKKGQIVVSLGNPYALARDGSASASWGIVSNVSRRPAPLDRSLEHDSTRPETIHHFGTLLHIETRTELGTSGGPVVNLRGELIGVTTSLAAIEGYEKTAGFAVPIDEFTRRIINELCRGYEVEYGFLGLTPRTAPPDQLRKFQANLKQASAVRVYHVIPNSPAAAARIAPDDLILEVEGRPVLDQHDLMRLVGLHGPEATVRLKVWRPRDARELTLTAKLGKWPVVDDEALIATSQRYPSWRGMTIDHSSGRQTYFSGWPLQFKEAVLVSKVAAKSPAQAAGLNEGDFVAGVNGVPVRSPGEFMRAVAKLDGDATLELFDKRRVVVRK